jgi:hypothetical protein
MDSRDRITFATFAVAALSMGLGIRTNIVIDDALQQQAWWLSTARSGSISLVGCSA